MNSKKRGEVFKLPGKESLLIHDYYFVFLCGTFTVMRKALALSFIVFILALAAYFFKPSEEACIQKAKEEFQTKSFYTIQSSPKEVDKNLLAKTLENNFLQALEVEDNFIYRTIYQNAGGKKKPIGWGAFGWVSVDIK